MTDATVLPHDLAAEQAVLGAILIEDSRFVDVAARLMPADFYRAAHSLIWQRAIELHARGVDVDPITLGAELSRHGELDDVGGPAYIASLASGAVRAAHLDGYIATVKATAHRRRLDAALRRGDYGEAAVEIRYLQGDGTEGRDGRRLVLTSAADISIAPVRWLWTDRLPMGTLALLGGREGVGKSVLSATLVAQVTRGTLPGDCLGRPRDVLIAAVEDSWSHTIVPRLMGAGADLARVHRVEVQAADGADALVLPLDVPGVRAAAASVDAALLVLDPLMSRINATLDTHRDAETRQALEPIARLADEAGIVVLGLVHVNKSATTDPLTSLMGSRAFAAVARTVLYVMRDPDEDDVRLLGLAKSNLGRLDVPTLRYTVEGAHVADTEAGPVWTGRLAWRGESTRTIRDALETAAEPLERTATAAAADWLADWLAQQPERTADSAAIRGAARAAGHTDRTLARARAKLAIVTAQRGYPRRTYWTLSVVPVTPNSGTTGTTDAIRADNTFAATGGTPASSVVPRGSQHLKVGTTGTTGTTDETGEISCLSHANTVSHANQDAFPRAREGASRRDPWADTPRPPGSVEAAAEVDADLAAGRLRGRGPAS